MVSLDANGLFLQQRALRRVKQAMPTAGGEDLDVIAGDDANLEVAATGAADEPAAHEAVLGIVDLDAAARLQRHDGLARRIHDDAAGVTDRPLPRIRERQSA